MPEKLPPSAAARLHLIYARASNGVIGKDNALPWYLPEDLAHFKRTTLGCPVIMGRKTWDSLPPQVQPLPGRANIVVSRNPEWTAPGAHMVNSIEAARALCPPGSNAWVIGGAQIYAAALPLASSVVVTEIARPYDGDVFAPELGPEWVETRREPRASETGLLFAFVTYTRAA